MSSVAAISSRVATKPVGLAGELKKIARVAVVTAAASLSGSRLQRPFRSSSTGAARAPDVSTAPTKFGQAGEGISVSSPGPAMRRVAISIACMPPMVTKKRSGENATPPGAAP